MKKLNLESHDYVSVENINPSVYSNMQDIYAALDHDGKYTVFDQNKIYLFGPIAKGESPEGCLQGRRQAWQTYSAMGETDEAKLAWAWNRDLHAMADQLLRRRKSKD